MKSRGLLLYVVCIAGVCAALGTVLWRRAHREDEAAAQAEQVVRIPATQGPTLPPGAPPLMPPGGGPLVNQQPLPMGRGGLAPLPPTLGRGPTGMPPFSGQVQQVAVVDLNTAPESALVTLPGITAEYAKAIVAHRPYRDKPDLEQKTGLPHAVVDRLGPPAMIRSTSIEPITPPVAPKKKGGSNP